MSTRTLTPPLVSLLVLTGLFALPACDSASPVSAEGTVTTDALPKGPPLSAFPQDALMTPEETERMLESGSVPSAMARVSADSLVVVPLVFDEDGRLHSPESFNALQDSLLALPHDDGAVAQRAADIDLPLLYFTDLATFRRVIGADGAGRSRTGPGTYAHLYRNGRGERLAVRESVTGAGARVAGGSESVGTFDPYVIPNDVPYCDLFPDDPNCDKGGGPGPPGGGQGGRDRNSFPQSTAAPEYPDLWRGDILSAERYSGGSTGSSGPAKLGHDAIVTELSSGGNVGGNIEDVRTQTMEAIGWRDDDREEVQERPARTWFVSPGDHTLRYAKVLDYTSTWGEIDTAVEYARGQDFDKYALTLKFDRSSWYCSKLVWASVKEGTGTSLDDDGGFYVYPSDIEVSNRTNTVYHWAD